MNRPHASVLLNEVLSFYEDLSLNYFMDATLGAGGHSQAILKAHPEINLLIGIDQDPVARKIAEESLFPWKQHFKVFDGNFTEFPSFLKQAEVGKLDGILFDLGVSSMQFDLAEKGFSFMHNGPLDMRMNPFNPLTAEVVVNTWSEEDLGMIFRKYGEEKRWRKAAYAIVTARKTESLKTTFDLVNVLKNALPSYNKKGIHPATLIFQALRICVNDELRVIEEALPQAIEYLRPGGRLSVISFHSLEDRIVKNAMRFAASDKVDTSGIGGIFLDKEPLVKILTRKPVTPTLQEIAKNPRSRSAKLRVIERLSQKDGPVTC
jgi:16S rRNA (cytosine1402-N4)-methyltransferase